MCYFVLKVLFFTSIALWATSGVVAYVGCWLFYRVFLVFGDHAKTVGRYFRKPHAPPRAVPQEAPIEEELGLLMEEELGNLMEEEVER